MSKTIINVVVSLFFYGLSFSAVAENTQQKKSPQKKVVVKKEAGIKSTVKPVGKTAAKPASRALGWSKDDKTCKITGGRYLCKRKCNANETGPSGSACKDKKDAGTSEDYCDCGTKTNGPSDLMNTAPQKL